MTDEGLAVNRSKYGGNKLPEPKKASNVRQFFKQLFNLFSVTIMVAGLLSIILFSIFSSDYVHVQRTSNV